MIVGKKTQPGNSLWKYEIKIEIGKCITYCYFEEVPYCRLKITGKRKLFN